MQDLSPTRGGGSSHPLAAGPWLPELVSYAGARSGEPLLLLCLVQTSLQCLPK